MNVFRSFFALILFPSLLITSCDTAEIVEVNDLLVVEAFLFEGEPVDSVRISFARPLSDESLTETPVNDAQVVLEKNGQSYQLASTNNNGYYNYQDVDLNVAVGDQFKLLVNSGDSEIFATTLVPEPPTGLIADTRVLVAPDFSSPPIGQIELGSIELSWDSQEGDLFFVVLKGPNDIFGEFILPEFVRERIGRRFFLITEPTQENFFTIRLRQLEFIGDHQAIVYKVNKEYADLYSSLTQDSRDLNEPETNIVNGRGVFSAFSSTRINFEVVR